MVSIKEIIKAFPHVKYLGNPDHEIREIVQLADIESKDNLLSWCSIKNIDQIKNIQKGTIICAVSVPEEFLKKTCNYLLVENPRQFFMQVIGAFFSDKNITYQIEKSASVHASANISQNVKIGHNVVIEEGVSVGEFSIIGHNTVILKHTKIGSNVKIGSNNTIGGVGFGYEKNETGSYDLVPHIGNVVIEDYVEIGNNTTIDRAVLGSTMLRKNAKIDNLVHIAHGVEIGENSLVIANAMVAGSVKVGKNVWIAPSASILNQKKVMDNAVIGMGAVVLKDVNQGEVIIGNPGKVLNK
jgi:UDP-3-O-[3-hydroxymyristoyl] glucosamine N-acyltransferase